MTNQNKSKKIALVVHSLSKGGLEKAVANLSFVFSKNNIEVHIITILDDIQYSYNGILYNLGKHKNNSIFNRIQRFYLLKKYLQKHRFDSVIDCRYRDKPWQEWLIITFLYPSKKTIYTIHSSKITDYLPQNKWLTTYILSKIRAIVSVSDAITKTIKSNYNIKNAYTIYNPILVDDILKLKEEQHTIAGEYIIAVGRFNYEKQFEKLIITYKETFLAQKNIKLLLIGEGPCQDDYKMLITKNKLQENIILLPFTTNPYRYIARAKFLVLCSLYEGFPMIILESLVCKTPVISFDLKTGPSEIIKHLENGLLIENQNFNALKDGLEFFEKHPEKYVICKENSNKNLEPFTEKQVIQQWLELLDENTI